jgi:hypothetical protein
MVVARITPQGLKLLSRLDEPVQEMHRKQLGHLGGARLKEFQEFAGSGSSQSGVILCRYICCN